MRKSVYLSFYKNHTDLGVNLLFMLLHNVSDDFLGTSKDFSHIK